MSVFLLVNNSTTVADVTPFKIFLDKGEAIRSLYEYEQVSVFKPIILYEYVLDNGNATYPIAFHKVKRNWKSVVEGIETIPVNPVEFRKKHPFIFDKLQAFTDSSGEHA